MKLEQLDLKWLVGIIGTVIVGTAITVTTAFSTFARAGDLEELETRYLAEIRKLEALVQAADRELTKEIAYASYYARLDDYEESTAEGNMALASEHRRQMERLEAIICPLDPEWERCDD